MQHRAAAKSRLRAVPGTGGVVVATGGGQLYALEATSGRKLWPVPVAGKRLRGAGDDGRVTQLLVELASDARTPPALLDEARRLLAGRRTGAEYMLKALERRYDFLNDVLRPPPVLENFWPLIETAAAGFDLSFAIPCQNHLSSPPGS